MVHAVLRRRPSASACASSVRNPASIRACPRSWILADWRAFISERTPGLVLLEAWLFRRATIPFASAERSVFMEGSLCWTSVVFASDTAHCRGVHRAACGASNTSCGLVSGSATLLQNRYVLVRQSVGTAHTSAEPRSAVLIRVGTAVREIWLIDTNGEIRPLLSKLKCYLVDGDPAS